MTHKRMALTMVLGVVVVLLATACAAVPAGQANDNLFSPTAFGTFTDFSLTTVDLFPAREQNQMNSMSLSHAAELTSSQIYELFYSHGGGCDRHNETYQEDLGAVTSPGNSN